jgi:histidine ammonia-lyase
MMLEYTAQAAAAEARSLASAMGTQTVWASLGVESHASLAATSARHTDAALSALRVIVATELVVAMRALAISEVTPTGAGTRPLFEVAREALPATVEDRPFGRDVEVAQALLADWKPIRVE